MDALVFGLLSVFLLGVNFILIAIGVNDMPFGFGRQSLIVLLIFCCVLCFAMGLQAMSVAGEEYIIMEWIFYALGFIDALLVLKHTIFTGEDVTSLANL
jgi:hypothetical protein